MLKIYVIEQYFSNFNIIMNHLGELVKNVAYDSVSKFQIYLSSKLPAMCQTLSSKSLEDDKVLSLIWHF